MKLTEENIKEWLDTNCSHIKLISYSGYCNKMSKFKDINRDVEFEYQFSYLKKAIKKNPNHIFSPSKEEIKKWVKDRCAERYGKIHPMHIEKVKEKHKQTCLSRYGVENVSQLKEIKEKKKESFLKSYGYKTSLQHPEIKKQCIETKIKKYGQQFCKNDNILKKARETKIKNGNLKLHEGKPLIEWSKILKTPLSSLQQNTDKYGFENAKKIKPSGPTSIEILMMDILKEFEVEFIYNKKLCLTSENIQPDFYIPAFNLVIECDGLCYHSDLNPHKNINSTQHKERFNFYKNCGLKFLYFYEDEFKNLDEIKKRIFDALYNQKINNKKPKKDFWWTNGKIRLESYEFSNDKEAALKGFYKLWGYQ